VCECVCVCVAPLDDIQAMVLSKFTSVPRLDIAPPSWDAFPFLEAHTAKMFTVVPVKGMVRIGVRVGWG